MSEYGYIPEAPEQSFGNNKGIFTPKDIYDLTRADKWTNYGQLELIETQTVSGVSTVDFTSIQESSYNVHFMTFNNMQNSGGASADLSVRFYESGVLETASVYQKAFQYGGTGGTFAEDRSTSVSSILSIAGNYQNKEANGYLYFYNLGDNTKYSFVTMQSFFGHPTAGDYMKFGSGVMTQASTVDGIRLFNDNADNFSAFDISLYGIRYS
jgi:hypothetical protein